MLTKAKIKYINALSQKKNRTQELVFVAEGIKVLEEILTSDFKVKEVFCTKEVFNYFSTLIQKETELTEVLESELEKISFLKTPQKVLALIEQKEANLPFENLENKLNLFLDDINDPGNLGTILRIAAWFGIENIICSSDCVDVYNPKVVQASMGAIAGKNILYVNKLEFFQKVKAQTKLPIFGTFLEGNDIYTETLSNEGIIVLGSEAHGISPDLQAFVTKKLFIPSFAIQQQGVESLNVAIAAAIVCSEFRRR